MVFSRAVPVAFASLLVFGGCNFPGSQDSFQPSDGACRIASDQQGAFMARVPDFPIPVHIDAAFSADERAQARNAIHIWNQFGQELIHGDFFSVEDESEDFPDYVQSQDCGASQVSGDSNELLLVRATRRNQPGRERVSSPENAVGITYRCTLGDDAERQLTVINVERVEASQVESVVLHELGHALGLDHSCMAGAGRPDFRSCFGLEMNHPYRLAVMYPSLNVNSSTGPEIKNTLTQNDMDRMACRYGPQ
jgi:hypothetical protein